jgi:HB1, ASXL, restriction endonuclease HTH domain
MTYLDAAETVLKGARNSLTAREITNRAIELGLLRSVHRTPEATMSAALYMHLKRGGQLVRRVAEPGKKRAVRGTVRWRPGAQAT